MFTPPAAAAAPSRIVPDNNWISVAGSVPTARTVAIAAAGPLKSRLRHGSADPHPGDNLHLDAMCSRFRRQQPKLAPGGLNHAPTLR